MGKRVKLKNGTEFEYASHVKVRARSAQSALEFFGYSSETHIVVDAGPCDIPGDSRHCFEIYVRGEHLELVK